MAKKCKKKVNSFEGREKLHIFATIIDYNTIYINHLNDHEKILFDSCHLRCSCS